MKLPRTVRFDQSDSQVYETAAGDGEWAVPGGFAFADDSAETLTGKRRQAFANGFLGLAIGQAGRVMPRCTQDHSPELAEHHRPSRLVASL